MGGATASNVNASVPAPFSILTGTPFNLPGFRSTNVTVLFAPASAASFSNVVSFSSANAGNISGPVIGTGAIIPSAAFTGSPTSGLKPLTVNFTDSSTGTITNRFWDFGDGITTNTTAASFSHLYTNASTNTVSLTITGPVGTNTLSLASYIVVTNLPPQLSLSPLSLAFGPVVIGQSNAQNFQVINTGGITLTGSVSANLPFRVQSGSPLNLTPGQTGLVAISFAPTSADAFTNAVVFTSNGGNSTNTVTGSGLTPAQLSVLPSSINFGIVAVGDNVQASFTITNLGGAALTNGVATSSGGPFSILSGTPFNLPGFGTTNLVIRFAPVVAANFSNVITFTTANDGNATNPVFGVGADLPVAGFTATPTSGLKPLTVNFSDTSTGTITNRFWNFGDGTTTNTTAVAFSHIYNNDSTNTVTLTIMGPVGTDTISRTNYIAVVTNSLGITSIQLSSSNVLISFTSQAGQFYRLEYADSLTGSTWQTAVDLIPGNGTGVQATHVGGAGNTSRFYRVKQLP